MQIAVGPERFDVEAAHVDIAAEARKLRAKAENAALPPRVKDGLVFLRFDRAEAMHAAHVVHAVHFDALTIAVPIIESRVTSAASCFSFMRSVPAGRSGITR